MRIGDVIALGWKDRHPKKDKTVLAQTFWHEGGDGGKWLMSVLFSSVEDDLCQVSIGWVDKSVDNNEWSNSDTCFHGMLLRKRDLFDVMRFIGVVEYNEIFKND